MLKYNSHLKPFARRLRSEMTESEKKLWFHLRKKQLGIQFYRQKSIGNYIVDFYGPRAKLVIEVDGGQHLENAHVESDLSRDTYLAEQGLKVLRFNNVQVLQHIDDVLEAIVREIPLNPPLRKGEVNKEVKKPPPSFTPL